VEVLTKMVSEGKGRLFKRKDGKFLIYLPKGLAEDSMFPLKGWQPSKRTGQKDSIPVKVSFVPVGPAKLVIEEEQ